MPERIPGAVFVPFTAQTRMSGLDLPDGTQVRKGAGSAVTGVARGVRCRTARSDSSAAGQRDGCHRRSGGTPLVVATLSAER